MVASTTAAVIKLLVGDLHGDGAASLFVVYADSRKDLGARALVVSTRPP